MTWNEYLDKVIELCKKGFYNGSDKQYYLCRINFTVCCILDDSTLDHYDTLSDYISQLPDYTGNPVFKFPYKDAFNQRDEAIHLQPRIDFLNSLKDKA